MQELAIALVEAKSDFVLESNRDRDTVIHTKAANFIISQRKLP